MEAEQELGESRRDKTFWALRICVKGWCREAAGGEKFHVPGA